MVSKKRQSNMELLRIISMLFIIMHHLIINGMGWTDISTNAISDNILLYNLGGFLETFFIIGVNVFFLISGYFLIKFSWKKIINIIAIVYVYMFLIQIFGSFIGYQALDADVIKRMILALSSYWFLQVYIILILVSPFLNKIVDNIKKTEAKYFILIYAVVFCIIMFLDDNIYIGMNRGYSFISACCLYLIGSFIRKGYILESKKLTQFKCFALYFVFGIINSLLILISINVLGNGKLASVLLVYNNPLIVLESIFFVKAFANIQFDEGKKLADVIRFFSANVLAVYILHSSNKVLVFYRDDIMNNIVNTYGVIAGYLLIIPYAILIFIACVAVDKIFSLTIGKIIGIVSGKIEHILMKIETKILNI